MSYSEFLQILLEATVKGVVRWKYLDIEGKPIPYPSHDILGEIWGYEAKVEGIELRIFPRIIEGKSKQLLALALVGADLYGSNRITSHTAAIPGVLQPERYALVRLYVAARKECLRFYNKKQFKREYSKRQRGRDMRKLLPRQWSIEKLIMAVNPAHF